MVDWWTFKLKKYFKQTTLPHGLSRFDKYMYTGTNLRLVIIWSYWYFEVYYTLLLKVPVSSKHPVLLFYCFRCQLHPNTLYYGFLIPMCLVITHNIIIFGLVVRVLISKRHAPGKMNFKLYLTNFIFLQAVSSFIGD